MDTGEDGKYEVSAQFALPQKLTPDSSSEGEQPPFFTLNGVGSNVQEAEHVLQRKLSRDWFAEQREILVFGEDLAQHGLSKVMDNYSRDPRARLSTDCFIVKDGTANDLLRQSYPLERLASFTPGNIHDAIGTASHVTLRNFLMQAVGEGDAPILPALEILSPISPNGLQTGNQSKNNATIQYFGTALFDSNLRLKGYLNYKDSLARRWIRGELKKNQITAFIPETTGNVGMRLTSLKSKINTSFQGDHVRINVTLTGKGYINENNTNLDLDQSKNVKMLESALDEQTRLHAHRVVSMAQSKYKLDVFAFGIHVHRDHPQRWKNIQKDWNRYFSDAKISVKVHVTVQSMGLTGPSLIQR